MRIIGGAHKGRKLSTFDLNHIRPTSDLVKEAIFNTLQFRIANGVFLDLFGGTGSVGLEALSRGAKKVIICDNHPKSIELIKKNNVLVGNGAQVILTSYDKLLKQESELKNQFDIIFLDPPYDTTYGEQAIKMIAELDLLRDQGIVVFEHHKTKVLETPKGLQKITDKTYGIKTVSYFQKDISHD